MKASWSDAPWCVWGRCRCPHRVWGDSAFECIGGWCPHRACGDGVPSKCGGPVSPLCMGGMCMECVGSVLTRCVRGVCQQPWGDPGTAPAPGCRWAGGGTCGARRSVLGQSQGQHLDDDRGTWCSVTEQGTGHQRLGPSAAPWGPSPWPGAISGTGPCSPALRLPVPVPIPAGCQQGAPSLGMPPAVPVARSSVGARIDPLTAVCCLAPCNLGDSHIAGARAGNGSARQDPKGAVAQVPTGCCAVLHRPRRCQVLDAQGRAALRVWVTCRYRGDEVRASAAALARVWGLVATPSAAALGTGGAGGACTRARLAGHRGAGAAAPSPACPQPPLLRGCLHGEQDPWQLAEPHEPPLPQAWGAVARPRDVPMGCALLPGCALR